MSDINIYKHSLRPPRRLSRRVRPERLDVPLLLPVPHADAGGHVDVLCAVRDGRPDGGALRRVGCGHQTQRGLLCGLPAGRPAALRQGLWRGEETVGGQREAGETGLTLGRSGWRGPGGIKKAESRIKRVVYRAETMEVTFVYPWCRFNPFSSLFLPLLFIDYLL